MTIMISKVPLKTVGKTNGTGWILIVLSRFIPIELYEVKGLKNVTENTSEVGSECYRGRHHREGDIGR